MCWWSINWSALVASGAGQRRTTPFQRISDHVRGLGGRNRPAQSNSTAKSVLEPFSRRARRPQVHVERECPMSGSGQPLAGSGSLPVRERKSPVKLNTPQSAPLGRVESARAAPDFSALSAQFATKTLPMPRATGICAPATCSCCRPAYHCCPAAAAAATAAARLAQRSVLAVASRPERWCQPRRAAPQNKG